MSASKFGWQDQLVEFGQRLSQVMEERFQFEVKAGQQFLPPPGPGDKAINAEAATRMFEIYIEYMFGTAVALSGHYISTDILFEENIVEMVREKFERLRKMEADGIFRGANQ